MYSRLKEDIYQTIRMLTTMNYSQIREVFPSEHPTDIRNVLDTLFRERRITGWAGRYQAS